MSLSTASAPSVPRAGPNGSSVGAGLRPIRARRLPDLARRRMGDHLINHDGNGEGDEFFARSECAVVLASKWQANRETGQPINLTYVDVFPRKTKTTEDTLSAFREFQGDQDKVGSFRADNAGELQAAAKAMRWYTPTSTPGMPASNGDAERVVRSAKEGAR